MWFRLLVLAVFLTAGQAVADERISYKVSIAMGGAPGLAVFPLVQEPSTATVTGRLTFEPQLRKLLWLQPGLEAVMPCGVGLYSSLVPLRDKRGWTVHLLDMGYFFNAIRPVSVMDVQRRIDLAVGLGVEKKLGHSLSVGMTYRAFFPAPIVNIRRFEHFYAFIADESLKGGQTWVSVSYSW